MEAVREIYPGIENQFLRRNCVPRKVIIDSGPLIALFDKDDRYHRRAMEFIKDFKGELITNYSVVTEVTYLLDFSLKAQTDFLQWLLEGGVSIMEIHSDDLDRVIEIMRKYSDLPGDFADATLIALCERLNIKEIASVDKDFTVYQLKDKQGFKNVFLN
jgi:uncharacterized protein